MPVTHGANPEELTALGNTLKQQAGPIDSLVSTVTSVLGGTSWAGPARQQFEDDWNTTFRTALDRLKSAFEAAGADCVKRAADLTMVMGSR
ncbi:MAG: hypothetical protein JWL72_3934 [Ilumatobacteraceae bacterium]|nr:hypothetical protein [Ilumatobacteraceae bacterium]MCU1390596.1 hypothetical protein [Ilumatobacteraceae bacterium]